VSYRKLEAICKKALTRESRAQVGLFDKKNRGRESRDTVPLKMNFIGQTSLFVQNYKFMKAKIRILIIRGKFASNFEISRSGLKKILWIRNIGGGSGTESIS
jgi:hypothetical protein